MLFDDLRNYFKRVLGGILLKKEAKQEEILQTQS
jgi:hypothetical protein